MDPQLIRTIIFLSVFILLLAGSDAYVIRRWVRHAKQSAWSRWTWIVPIVLAVLILPLTLWLMYERRSYGQVTTWMNLGLIVSSVWYVSKAPAFLFFLISDVLRLMRFLGRKSLKLARRIGGKQASPAQPTATLPDTSRRQFVNNAGWAMAGAPFLLSAYGVLRTIHDFEVVRHDIKIPNLPRQLEGLTVGQLSDVHAGSFPTSGPPREIVELVTEQKPDMLVVTGDWVNFDPRELKSIFPAFEKLQADLGVYGSLGNHDHYMTPEEHQRLQKAIRVGGIDLLVNENRVLEIEGAKLQIAGIDNTGLRQNFGDIDAALRGLDDNSPTLLMAHDPTFWDKEVRGKRAVDLMMSGHTHGGQLGLHVLDKEYSFAQIAYEQWVGKYSDGNQHLYINRGLGTTALPIRVGINPELTLLTLRRA